MGETFSQTVKIRLCNSLSVDRELWIEPFGDLVIVSSGSSVEIVLDERPGEVPEVEVTDTSFLVHGWVKLISATDDKGRTMPIWGDGKNGDNGKNGDMAL